MDIGDYYCRSFGDLKENPNILIPSFVGAVLINVIMFIIFEFLEPRLFINEMITPEIPDMILTDVVIPSIPGPIVAVVINSFIYAATIGMAEKILEGQKADLEVAWKSGMKYFIKILAVSIIMGLITAVLILPFILGLILINVHDILLGLAVTVLGVVILIVGIILLSLAFMVVNQSIVIGKKSIIDSIKDSVNVFAKNKLDVFIVAVINLVIVAAIYFVITISAIGMGFVLEIPYVILILGIVVEIILTTYLILVITYLYMDIKEKLPGQISVNNL